MSVLGKARVCSECGDTGYLQAGWTNSLYCSEQCETKGVSAVHESMPGAGGLPYPNWVPSHIREQISNRWED